MNFFQHKQFRRILAGFLLITLFFTVFGQKGLLKIFKLKKDLAHVEERIHFLSATNQSMMESIHKMKNQTSFQEREIREILGLVQDGDIIYEFQD